MIAASSEEESSADPEQGEELEDGKTTARWLRESCSPHDFHSRGGERVPVDSSVPGMSVAVAPLFSGAGSSADERAMDEFRPEQHTASARGGSPLQREAASGKCNLERRDWVRRSRPDSAAGLHHPGWLCGSSWPWFGEDSRYPAHGCLPIMLPRLDLL